MQPRTLYTLCLALFVAATPATAQEAAGAAWRFRR